MPHEIHVRRRIDVTQRAVDRERVGGDFCLEALRQDRLVDVACGDVLLDGAHARFEDVTRLVGRELRRVASGCRRLREAPFELTLEELDLRARELIEGLEILVRRDSRVGDDQDPMLDVIEGQDGIEEHEAGLVFVIGPARESALLPRLQERRLEGRRGVVADEADGAAREARQTRNERRSEFGHQPAQRGHELVRHVRSSRRTGRSSSCPARDRRTRKGSLPRNEYRATCSPPSTLSKRNA